MVQLSLMMVPMKPRIAERVQVSVISGQVQFKKSSLESAWEQCYEKPDELPLYKLRSDSRKIVYDKLHEEGFPAAEEHEPEETYLSEKQHGIVKLRNYSSHLS